MSTPRQERLVNNILKYPTRKEAMIKTGYSESYATCGHIRKQEGFQKAMKTVLTKLENERERILTELSIKNLSEEKYETLINAMDKVTKNIQLLTGGETERSKVIIIPSDIANKYADKTDTSTEEDSSGHAQV